MFHILHYHNSIIHDNTDSKNQSQQCQYIQRETENKHETESTDQRNRHCNNRYQSSTPALQWKEHYQYHKNQCFEQCLIHLVDRLRNIGSHVKRYLVTHSFRKVRTDFFHCLLHVVRHFHSIGTRKHINAENCRIFTVNTTFRTIWGSFKWHSGHIAKTNNRPIGIGTDHNILKLLCRAQTTLRCNRNCNVQTLHRLLSQNTGSRFAVLVFQSILQILNSQSEICQFVWHGPDLHGIVTATDIRHTSHTGNTA